ncbi:hypothetical protein AYI68_g6544, partial [Smittium mucronatum]
MSMKEMKTRVRARLGKKALTLTLNSRKE